MSTIKVEVTTIEDVRIHPSADVLQLATVGGWQVIVKKGEYKSGDSIVYFEQGTVLPAVVAEVIGVTNYLSQKTDIDGNRVLVVHRVKLRGEPSFGLVIQAEPGMEVGDDVAVFYGATKFMPPVKTIAGDAETPHPLFYTYTDIENMRSYPDVFEDGEWVVATEKIHGTNCRVGFIINEENSRNLISGGARLVAGSKSVQRKQPASTKEMKQNTYWYPHTLEGVQDLFIHLEAVRYKQAILFGEVYGKGIQSYTYGQNQLSFRAFDLMVDGKYLDSGSFDRICANYGIETAPVLYCGEYSLEAIKRVSDGPSVVGGIHGREGVVVRPMMERQDARIGRVILKYVGDNYLFGKGSEHDTTDA